MNPDSENFDSLRQLLALKRHEIPPPGYFDRFSRDVMARIKAGERGGEFGGEVSWFQRFVGMFDIKPVFAGAFGTAVCAFLISGVISSEQTPVMGGAVPTLNNAPALAVVPGNATASTVDQMMASSTNSGGSLFDQFPIQAAQVSDRFYLPGNN